MNIGKLAARIAGAFIVIPIVLCLTLMGFFYSTFYFPNWSSATPVAGVNYFFRRRQLFLPVLSLHHWSTFAQSDAKSVRSSGSEISARLRS